MTGYSKAKDDTHICKLCGFQYHSCDACVKGTYLDYQRVCESKEHYEILQIISSFIDNSKTKEECAELLTKYDLLNINSWLSGNQSFIKDILDIEDIIEPINTLLETEVQTEYSEEDSLIVDDSAEYSKSVETGETNVFKNVFKKKKK